MSIASEMTLERQHSQASFPIPTYYFKSSWKSNDKWIWGWKEWKGNQIKSGKKCGMKTGDFPSPHGEGFLWEKLVYWWWLYTEEDSFSRFCKGRWLETTFPEADVYNSWNTLAIVLPDPNPRWPQPWENENLLWLPPDLLFTLSWKTPFRESTCLFSAQENHFLLLLHIMRLRCSWP